MLQSLRIRSALSVALEDIANGQKAKEKEYVWYGKLADPTQLDKAIAKEEQYQSNAKGRNGSVRVRKSVKDGEQKFILTAKNYMGGPGSGECEEVSQPVSEDMYNVFRGMSGESMDKIRYTFDAGNGLVWEVDVFIDTEGKAKEWVKIDLEDNNGQLVSGEFPPLPVTLNEMIFHREKEYTPQEKSTLSGLFRDVFVNQIKAL